MDQRYLNCNKAPTISPLLKYTRIEFYNDKWLQPQGNYLNTKLRHINLPSSKINSFTFDPHASIHIPSIEELDGDPPPIPELCHSLAPTLPPSSQFPLQSKILSSSYRHPQPTSLLLILYNYLWSMSSSRLGCAR